MDSVKILLFSDDEKLYNSTERIIGKKHQLKWCTYQQLENNRYPTADVVIFHFTKEIIERERAFAAIIKIKGSLGHLTPILAISEGGSIQDIFSILKAGAYDYIETIDNTRKYKKKIENLILWNWTVIRFRGDKEKADNVYKGIRPLTGDDIAETVYFAASVPEYMQIAEMLVMPTYQATGTIVSRK